MLLLAVLVAVPASAQAQAPSVYSVAVTQPDELGLPVTLDTDVYLPSGQAPASGWPLVIYSHGGGNQKREGLVVSHAQALTQNGYAMIAYSARGHGNSTGQTSVAGPKEMRDLFDVADWALGRFPLDRSRIALGGESQGGLYTNGGQVHSFEPDVNPYGIRFRALLPGNTPDYVYDALVPSDVVKLSFGIGLVQTYLVGAQARMSPSVLKWITTLALNQPGLFGGAKCDTSGHDTLLSTTKSDIAYRSPGCFAERMNVPTLWAQSFDDGLFPAEMAVSMLRRMNNDANRLYLTFGGHAAPFTRPEATDDELAQQIAFLDSVLKAEPPGAGSTAGPDRSMLANQLVKRGKALVARGKKLRRKARKVKRQGNPRKARRMRRRAKRLIRKGRRLIQQGLSLNPYAKSGSEPRAEARAEVPPVIYWRRDPRVAVTTGYQYPPGSWTRHTSESWPPPGTTPTTLQLGSTAQLPLAPLSIDEANDPVTLAALSATPIGTSPIPSQIPATSLPGFLAAFETSPFGGALELDGQVSARLSWTPLSPDSQIVVKVFDRAPDGTVTLLSRGVAGVRGAAVGVARQVTVNTNEISALIPAGHKLLTWVSAGELGFYLPTVPSLGGLLGSGPASTISVPLRSP